MIVYHDVADLPKFNKIMKLQLEEIKTKVREVYTKINFAIYFSINCYKINLKYESKNTFNQRWI